MSWPSQPASAAGRRQQPPTWPWKHRTLSPTRRRTRRPTATLRHTRKFEDEGGKAGTGSELHAAWRTTAILVEFSKSLHAHKASYVRISHVLHSSIHSLPHSIKLNHSLHPLLAHLNQRSGPVQGKDLPDPQQCCVYVCARLQSTRLARVAPSSLVSSMGSFMRCRARSSLASAHSLLPPHLSPRAGHH